MSLSPRWVPFFPCVALEATHWSAVGKASAPDAEIMEHATANGFVVFTHDLDFGTLLAVLGRSRPSVIQVRTHDVLPSAIGPAVLRAIRSTEQILAEGALVNG